MELSRALKKYFNYDTFQTGQEHAIKDLMSGKDVLLTLPTGAGKSICYQLPALLSEGLTLVVTPLLSLMEDQVNSLKKLGIKRVAALNSFNTKAERRVILNSLDQLKIIYISPELLNQNWMENHLKKQRIAYIVIDEAHCISQWGHEFRPDYMNLNKIVQQYNKPTLLLVTATLTKDVKKDILDHFKDHDLVEHLHPIEREQLSFIVEKCKNKNEKDNYLLELFERFYVPTMIYFSSKKEAERVALFLNERFPSYRISYYHSDLESKDRMLIQQQFVKGELDVICATSAFGMGVNKPDVRLVIHYHLPTQIESFVQEVGRAGRDNLPSVSITLLGEDDYAIPERLIESELPDSNLLSNLYQILMDPTMTTKTLDTWLNDQGVNEVIQRFIKNFLENEGVIKDNSIQRASKLTPAFFDEWQLKLANRHQHKRKKLIELFQVVTATTCYRELIYRQFQNQPAKKAVACCSNCGYNLDGFRPALINYKEVNGTWNDKLQMKLLPFEYHEPRG